MRTITIENMDLDSVAGGDSSTPMSDAFTEFLQAPVTKLDADQYMAEDLDGVTESVFGSGNLNFLMLQSGQTDGAMALNDPNLFQGGEEDTPLSAVMESQGVTATLASGGYAQADETQKPEGSEAGGPKTPGVSGLSAGAPSSSGTRGTDTYEGGGETRPANADFHSRGGADGADGSGRDGHDGANGDPTGDIFNQFSETNLTDLSEVNHFVDNVFTEINDLTQILEGDNLTDTVTNTTNSTAETLQTNLTNILNQLPILGGDGAADPADTDVALGGILPEGPLDLILDPVEDLAGDLDIGVNVGSLLGEGETDNALGDSDLGLGGNLELMGSPLGLPQLDLALDPIEALTGDIDLDFSAAGNLLGAIAPALFDAEAGGSGLDNVQTTVSAALTPMAGDFLGGGDNDGGSDNDISLGSDLALDTPDLGMISEPLGLGDGLSLNGLNETLGVDAGALDAALNQLNLSDAGLGAGGDLLDQAGDFDLLNPSEGLDLNGGAADGVQTLALDPVEDLIGDIDLETDIAIMSGGDTGNAAGDSDVHLPLDLDLAGNNLGDTAIDIPLDPVESLIGDIDLNLGAATNLLGQQAGGMFDDGAGGTGDSTIISNLSDDAGGLAGDALGDIPPQTGDALPAFDLGALTDGLTGMDSGITSAIDLLPSSGGDTSGGGSDVPGDLGGWTESVIPDAGGLLGDMNAGADAGSILPDPIGQISEGLGGLLDSGSSGSGGLLAGPHHLGGLFG